MKALRKKYHTGSADAQDKKVRVATVESPVASKSKRDSDTDNGDNGDHIALGTAIRVLSLNVEGISSDKCDYLARLLRERRVDVVVLQETHLGPEPPPSRYKIQGYSLISKIDHRQYGIATYAKDPSQASLLSASTDGSIHRIAIKYGDLTVVNVYKPPNTNWPQPVLPNYLHHTIVAGDFNSHHTAWGYRDNDEAGERVAEWAELGNMHLLYSPRDPGTFRSARWQREYNPDLTFTTRRLSTTAVPATRVVLGKFPHSQHRPILITTGTTIPVAQTVSLPRWNFRRADWQAFTDNVENTCQRIPAVAGNMVRFNKLILSSARKHIPRGYRKRYIPCWSEESENLFQQYEETGSEAIADELLASLSRGRRDRWVETVESLDFKRSSRHAWRLLKRLDGDGKPAKTKPPLSADEIARDIKQRGTHSPDHKFESLIKKQYQRLYKSHPEESELSAEVSSGEILTALRMVSSGKAAGLDGVYPDMIKHLGQRAREWLANAFTDAINKGQYCHLWKRAKVLAILKPGKPANLPDSYRPISLLCCLYKLFERVVLTRLSPVLERYIPQDQAGFRPSRGTSEQVIALTSLIESGYEQKLKTGSVFVDLSAAYDTVWREGLMYKLARIIPDKKMLRVLSLMTGCRYFCTYLGDEKSKMRKVKNGVPQGSVIAPALFNVYMGDMPETCSRKFGYADDWAIVAQSGDFNSIERTLSGDMESVASFFRRWYLRMNLQKTVTSVFHLNNRQAGQTLQILVEGQPLPSETHPKYLGVTLDRSLTYNQHLTNTAQKLKTRNSLISKLTSTAWGASQEVLRTSVLALCYSVAEYCSPVWERSSHTHKVDVQLNHSMRLISGAVKSTPIPWLPTMCHIAPPHLRRKLATNRTLKKLNSLSPNTPLREVLAGAPATHRLTSRKPFYKIAEVDCDMARWWRSFWADCAPRGGEIITDPTWEMPGFRTCNRKQWVSSNRLISKHGRTSASLYRWGLAPSPLCPRCGMAPQDADHLVLHCPFTSIPGGYAAVLACGGVFFDWLERTGVEV